MRRWRRGNQCIPLIATAFGLGVLLCCLTPLKFVLFIAAVILVVVGICICS